MQAFAVRYIEAIADGPLPIRLQDVATAAGVTAQTVSEWRNQTPGFNDWLAMQLTAYVQHVWPAVKAVAVRFAMRGSIDHMRFLRELMEPTPQRPGPGQPPGILAGAIIVNVPQPPNELEGHLAVRGLIEMTQPLPAGP